MEFDRITENITLSEFEELTEAGELLDAYRRHVVDGLHEALNYRIEEVFDEALSRHLGPLLRTFHHLLEDDPDADDEVEAEYGSMLGSANMHAAIGLTRRLQDSDWVKEAISETIRRTVEDYASMEFGDAEED